MVIKSDITDEQFFSRTVSGKDINIAYILLCHTDACFVAHTVKTLKYKNDCCFIHVDKKTDILPFKEMCAGLTNVRFVDDSERVENFWGGFNSIIATFNTVSLALSTGHFDRFVLLQGQDYPLFSNSTIHDFFIKNYNVEFCKATEISHSKNKEDYIKCACMWHFDKRNFFWRIVHKLNRIFGVKYMPAVYKNGGLTWNVYHGWAQFALTNSCMKYCLGVYTSDNRYNKFMKHRFPPDELYIQTIVHNSPFAENLCEKTIYDRNKIETKLNLTYFEYPVNVTIFNKREDYYWLKETGCLYARKINSSSENLIDEIDSNIIE